MLRYMRENTGSWIIKILLGLVILVFIFLGMGSNRSKRHNTAAIVDDQAITMAEYQRSYDAVVEQMRRTFGKNLNEKMMKMFQVKKQALNRLIDERLLLKEADRLNVQVSDKELRDSLLGIPAFKRDGAFDLKTYTRVLARNRLTPEMFEASQKQSLKEGKIKNLVLRNIMVSDMEAVEWYEYNNIKISIDYLSFEPSAYKNIEPDHKKIYNYYNENKTHYKSLPMRKVVYLRFLPDDYSKEVTISSKAAKEYYDENMDKFNVPAEVEARHILIKVASDAPAAAVEKAKLEADRVYKMAVKGDDFASLAKKFSQGPSGKNGGYLGRFSRSEMIKPFANKAFSMKKGEISKPLRTRFGWHIIKVEAVFPASTKPFKEVESSIVKKLKINKMKNLAYDDAGKAFDAIIDGNNLKDASLATGRKIRKTGPFTQKGTGLSMENAGEFARTAFSLPLNEISDIKEVKGAYYIIKPVAKIAPAVLDFDKVKQRVKQDLISELQQENAKKDAEAFLTALKKDKNLSLQKLAQAKALKVKFSKLFNRNKGIPGISGNRKITNAAFKLSSTDRVYPKVIHAENNFYIISFKDKKVPDPAEIDANLDKVKKTLARTKQGKIFAAFLNDLRNNSTIKIEPGVVD